MDTTCAGYCVLCAGMASVNKNAGQVIYCKHSDLRMIKGDITFELCMAINKMFSGQALCAQKLKAVWAICIRESEARKSLLRRGVMIGKNSIDMYPDNPLLNHGRNLQRVVIKDLPFWEPDSLIIDYLKSIPQITQCSGVYLSKARNNITNETSSFLNGDRFVFVNEDMYPPLPMSVPIGDYLCRIRHSSQTRSCLRCRSSSHKTDDAEACPAFIQPSDNVLPFSSGVLSNFNRCPVTIDNLTFPSSEHAYQWRACTEALRADLAEKVVKAGTPREAKQIAAQVKHDSSSNWHNIKCDVMKEVLSAKMKCSKPFRDALIASGTKVLVEARLDDFWGSGLTYNLTLNTHPDKYPGSNQLGLILSELRHELMSKPTDDIELMIKPTDIDIDDPVIQGQSDTDSVENSTAPIARPRRPTLRTGSQNRSTSHSPTRVAAMKKGTPLIKDFMIQQMKKRKRNRSSVDQDSQDIDAEAEDGASTAASVSSFASAVDQTIDIADMNDFSGENPRDK